MVAFKPILELHKITCLYLKTILQRVTKYVDKCRLYHVLFSLLCCAVWLYYKKLWITSEDLAISSVSLGPDCNLQCSLVATEAERATSSGSKSFVSLEGEVMWEVSITWPTNITVLRGI